MDHDLNLEGLLFGPSCLPPFPVSRSPSYTEALWCHLVTLAIGSEFLPASLVIESREGAWAALIDCLGLKPAVIMLFLLALPGHGSHQPSLSKLFSSHPHFWFSSCPISCYSPVARDSTHFLQYIFNAFALLLGKPSSPTSPNCPRNWELGSIFFSSWKPLLTFLACQLFFIPDFCGTM